MTRDPWRYRCPHCGSAAVVRLTSCARPRGESYRVGGDGAAAAKDDAGKGYSCKRCGERAEKLVDMKRTQLATPCRP